MTKKHLRGFKFLLHKAYFDKGMSFTSYIKYMIAYFGAASQDVETTLLIGVAYAVFCYFFGFFFYKWGFIAAEYEIGNAYNLFVREVRKKLKKQKV